MDSIVFPFTLPELEIMIFGYQRLLESSPRSDPNRSVPNRSKLLMLLGASRSQRRPLLNQNSDLDKAITHFTETVLLPPTQHVVYALFCLAVLLLSRYPIYRRPDDIKASIKYFRFLRINFHSLEAFDIPQANGDLPSHLLSALAHNLVLTPCDIVQDLEEMVALIPEVITADILTYHEKHIIKALGEAIARTEMFCQEDTQQVTNRAIRVLREATVLNPDFDISYALAQCLVARFETMLVMNDCDEAIAIADRIVATHSPGNSLTTMQKNAMMLISGLLVSRLSSFSRPEYLEDAIRRIRTFVPRLPDEDRTEWIGVLTTLTRQRFEFFGVTGNLGGIPPNPHFDAAQSRKVRVQRILFVGKESGTRSQYDEENLLNLSNVDTAISNGEIMDVEAAVERSRKLLSLQQSRDQWPSSYGFASMFASILFQAHIRTERSDYLNEAISRYHDLYKMPAPKMARFHAGSQLFWTLTARLGLFNLRQDFEELMQLCFELANDDSGEVFTRYEFPCVCAIMARARMHPSASVAYETAMSLLQETLVFCPTLQTQHLRLAQAFRIGGRLPSDYASYQIENGQVKQAVETLERGRALIWSEMRGLRTSTDHLRAANPALADKFTDINRRLDSVTTSVAQSDDDEIGRHGSEGRREDLIGHLVLTQRTLLEERNSLISQIQFLPGFENFSKPLSFGVLESAAACGPVIIINVTRSEFSSFILLLLKDFPPAVISTPSDFNYRANQLKDQLLSVRKGKGLDSNDYDLTLASVLADLYELVGRPVVDRLRELKVPEKSRVWWCPTGAFCSLPLHAMGPIPSDDGNNLYFSDLFIPSYTPTLSALIESRKRGSYSEVADNSKPSILLVAQPDTLPGAFGEINAIETTKTQVTTLISAMATPETVIKGLRDHRFAHFVCHGLLEQGKPFDASLELHKANLTLLEIVRSHLPAAEFAFLAACHTAELTEGSVADEGLHLSAAMQYCGFRSVVGTMWAMADTDGADLSKHFYKTIFSDKADQNGVPYHERSARALQIAVQKLRKKRGMTLERWVNFVHYGA